METRRQSQIFDINKFFWNIFGIWPGNIPIKYYNYYSLFYITIFTIVYDILLTVNLIYTPRNLEALIREFVFFFTEVAVISKIAMILVMRKKIVEVFQLIDCGEFQAHDTESKKILDKNNSNYLTFWKINAIASNGSYFAFIVLPILLHFILKADIELPICKYYFLSPKLKDQYFWVWFIYQSIGIYAHMTYNINIDSFIAGLLLVGIGQMNVLSYKFSQLQKNNEPVSEDQKLKKLLQHYDVILRYCAAIQEILSMVMFVQFCMASVIICVTMFGLQMVSSPDLFYAMVSYLSIMTTQIFVPGWLGTKLEYKSHKLTFAAYNSDWITKSESYKQSLCLFILRAQTPIVLMGLKIFPLSLKTFISIMKMAYSLFALLRKVQDRQL